MIDTIREENTAEGYSIGEVCEAFEVSRSGYYAARSRPEGQRSRERRQIAATIEDVRAGDRHTRCYGSPRMAAELASRDVPCSRNRCASIMREMGIDARRRGAFRPRTTVPDKGSSPSPNLLRDAPAPTGPGEVYVGDITYVATGEGWLYLATVLDLFSRKVAGWKLG